MQVFLNFASRGKNAWWRYVVACVLAIVIWLLLTVLPILGLLVFHVISRESVAALRNPAGTVGTFLLEGLTFGGLLVGLMASVAVVQRKRPGDVIGRWQWSLFLYGMGVWFVLACAFTFLDFVLAPRGFALTVSGATLALAVTALVVLPIQTFAEEFIFRGYLTQGLLLALKRPVPAAIASGLLFGALHIPNGTPQAVQAVVFGCVGSLIAIRTGGIALTFGVHLINNYFGAVIVVLSNDVFKGSPGIFTQNTPNLLWFDAATGILSFFILLWLVVRKQSASGAELSPT